MAKRAKAVVAEENRELRREEEIVDSFLSRRRDAGKRHEDTKREFATLCESDPSHAIEWRAEDVVMEQAALREWQRAVRLLDDDNPKVAGVGVAGRFKLIIDRAGEDLDAFTELRPWEKVGSNAIANAMNIAVMTGRTRALREIRMYAQVALSSLEGREEEGDAK